MFDLLGGGYLLVWVALNYDRWALCAGAYCPFLDEQNPEFRGERGVWGAGCTR